MSAIKVQECGLLVRDILVNSTGAGADWWMRWRSRMEQVGRVLRVPGTATPMGDHVWIRRDDPAGMEDLDLRAEAETLRDMQRAEATARATKERMRDNGGES